MQLQKINWKIFFKNPSAAQPDDFFRVFDTWIAALSHPGTPDIFIDVADYQHVHDGPLTILIGHSADFVLDDSGRRRGLLYSQKREEMEGTNAEKLKSSLLALLKGAERLEKDPIFGGKISFNTDELEMIVNDRALAPNTKETYQALKPELDSLATTLFGKGAYTFEPLSNPKQRFSVRIKSQKEPGLPSLIAKL